MIGKTHTNFLAGPANNSMVGDNNQGGAVLNIQTASDINIYNNSFIVKSSSTEKEQQQKANSNRSLKEHKSQTSTLANQKKVNKLAGQKLLNEKG